MKLSTRYIVLILMTVALLGVGVWGCSLLRSPTDEVWTMQELYHDVDIVEVSPSFPKRGYVHSYDKATMILTKGHYTLLNLTKVMPIPGISHEELRRNYMQADFFLFIAKVSVDIPIPVDGVQAKAIFYTWPVRGVLPDRVDENKVYGFVVIRGITQDMIVAEIHVAGREEASLAARGVASTTIISGTYEFTPGRKYSVFTDDEVRLWRSNDVEQPPKDEKSPPVRDQGMPPRLKDPDQGQKNEKHEHPKDE